MRRKSDDSKNICDRTNYFVLIFSYIVSGVISHILSQVLLVIHCLRCNVSTIKLWLLNRVLHCKIAILKLTWSVLSHSSYSSDFAATVSYLYLIPAKGFYCGKLPLVKTRFKSSCRGKRFHVKTCCILSKFYRKLLQIMVNISKYINGKFCLSVCLKSLYLEPHLIYIDIIYILRIKMRPVVLMLIVSSG